MQWISHMQLAVTSRAKHCKKSIWLKALCSITIAPSIHTIQVFDLKLKWNEHSLSFSFSSFGRFLFCWQKSLLSRFSKDLSVFKKKEKTEEKKRKFLLPIFFHLKYSFFTFSLKLTQKQSWMDLLESGFIARKVPVSCYFFQLTIKKELDLQALCASWYLPMSNKEVYCYLNFTYRRLSLLF